MTSPENGEELRGRSALGHFAEADALDRKYSASIATTCGSASGVPGTLRPRPDNSALTDSSFGLQGEVTRGWQVYGGYAHLDGASPSRSARHGSDGFCGRKQDRAGAENTFSFWNNSISTKKWGAGLGFDLPVELLHSFNNTVKLPASGGSMRRCTTP